MEDGLRQLLAGLTPKEGSQQKDLMTTVAGAMLSGNMAQAGQKIVQDNIQRAALSELEKQFKARLVKDFNIKPEIVNQLSLSNILAKRDQVLGLSDEQLWGSLQKVMVENAGLDSEISGMLVGLLQQNVSMDEIKKLLSPNGGLPQAMFKELLKSINNNPKLARLVGDHPECLQMLKSFQSKQTLSVQDMIQALLACQRRQPRFQTGFPDSDGYNSSPRRSVAGDESDEESDEQDESDEDESDENDQEDESDESDESGEDGEDGEDDESDEEEESEEEAAVGGLDDYLTTTDEDE
jgi:hypothetical protein